MPREAATFHHASVLMGLLGYLEAAMTDIACKVLLAYPGKLSGKSVDFKVLAECGSITEVLSEKSQRAVADMSYARFDAYAEKFFELFSAQSSPHHELIATVGEMKATRDIYAHAGGRVNRTYLDKAGVNSRATQIGGELGIDQAYTLKAFDEVSAFLDAIEAAIPDKIKNHGRIETVKQMWEATVLEARVPSTDAWVEESQDIARPSTQMLGFAWSHSEKMLVDFFLGIYSEDHTERLYSLVAALDRWPARSHERIVMQSWLEAPFGF